MKISTVPLGVALFALVLAGCGESKSEGDTGGTGATGGTTGGGAGVGGSAAGAGAGGGAGMATAGMGGGAGTAGAACETITASVAQNYGFTSTITLAPIMVQPDVELTFDWSQVDTDLLGHAMDPMTDVDMVELVLWDLTLPDLEMRLNSDQLEQRDTEVIANIETAQAMTSMSLFQFTSLGTPLTPEDILPYMSATAHPPAENTYTVMIATGTVLGQGTRLLQSFKLDPTSTNTTVTMTNSSVDLVWQANLAALTSPLVTPGTNCINVDWSGMTVNAMGFPFEPTDITEVLVGKYNETPAELQAQFLDLEVIQEDIWRAEVTSGTSWSLATLVNESGAPFPGIDATGTWVLALICGDCANPAPWYLTILKPAT